MTDIPFNRKVFNWVLWAFTGICILVIVTSCAPVVSSIAADSDKPQVTVTRGATPTLPTPSPIPANLCADVTAAESLHVRTGPGVEYAAIGYLAHGERVRIIQYDQAGNFPDLSLSQWWKIRTAQGLTGWARSTFLNQTICTTGE